MNVETTEGIIDTDYLKVLEHLEIWFLPNKEVRIMWNVQEVPRVCNALLDKGIVVEMPPKGDKWSGFGRNPSSECYHTRTERVWITKLKQPIPRILFP